MTELKYYASCRGAGTTGLGMDIRKIFLEEGNPGFIIEDKSRGEYSDKKSSI